MARILAAQGWPMPGSPAAVLHEVLPDDYLVVADPTVRRQAFDAVVVGPQGLFVLHGGESVGRQSAAEAERRARGALRAFLQDEFPGLHPALHHLQAATGSGHLPGTMESVPSALATEAAADVIMATPLLPDAPLIDEEMRESLALALRDRRLTVSQRADEPFIFRSRDRLGRRNEAWTVRELVEEMDRHPEDGLYHLRNGTVERWLSQQGAEHLAELAREVTRRQTFDRREPLERFLLGTGLVPRPRLVIRPPIVDLGYIIAGERAEARLQIRKGAGRGYLFGSVQAAHPWLHIEPEVFDDGAHEAVVRVNTEGLLIGRRPYESEILIKSSASDEPVAVPVQFQVVGRPSPLNHYLARPLAGLVTAGPVGALIGWFLALSSPQGLQQVAAWWGNTVSTPATGAVVIGLLWAILGAVGNFYQPPAWPVSRATARQLARMVACSLALGLFTALIFGLRRQLGSGNPVAGALGPLSGALLGLALGIVPAVIGTRGFTRGRSAAVSPQKRRSPVRPAFLATFVVVALVVAMSVLEPARLGSKAGETVTAVERRLAGYSTQLEAELNRFVEELYLRRYDRRAP